MKRIYLRTISFQKQMTVILPCLLAVLLTMGVLTVERFRQTEVMGEDGTAPPADVSLSLEQPLSLLCITHEEDTVFFSCLSIQPSGEISAQPLEGLKPLYRKNGAAALKETVGTTYYADMSFEDVRQLLQYCGGGVSAYPETVIDYVDSAGLRVRFPAGRLHLTANRTVDFLRGLAEDAAGMRTVARMHADLFTRYALQTERVAGIYAAFAEYANTDIRIYDFQKYLPVLEQLAAQRTEKTGVKQE